MLKYTYENIKHRLYGACACDIIIYWVAIIMITILSGLDNHPTGANGRVIISCRGKMTYNIRIQAIKTINKSFFQGSMSPSWYTTIDIWFDKYGFETDLMIMLFRECFDRKALSHPYVQKVAQNWYNAGVKTINDYEIYKRSWKERKKVSNQKIKQQNITNINITINL